MFGGGGFGYLLSVAMYSSTVLSAGPDTQPIVHELSALLSDAVDVGRLAHHQPLMVDARLHPNRCHRP